MNNRQQLRPNQHNRLNSLRFGNDQEEEKMSQLASDGEGVEEEEKIAADHDYNEEARERMAYLRDTLEL